jgi:hypothetical protein
MTPQRWSATPRAQLAAAQALALTGGDGNGNVRQVPAIDWAEWLRGAERKRRLLARVPPEALRPFWTAYFVAATDSSFRLDGLVVPANDLAAALTRGWARRALASRQQQRVRNHVAIMRAIERYAVRGDVLEPSEVIRWYTTVACGLSTAGLDDPTAARLDGVIRQINSPHLRLCPALQGIARLHRQLLADPILPSFNGILARLLLRYQLARCGLPPVLFDPAADGAILTDEDKLLGRLVALIDATYDVMLGKA